MRVLLDTNIVLDVLLARAPFDAAARDIWHACEHGRCTGFLASVSVTNIWYIGRRSVGAASARQHLADVLQVLHVCSVDFDVLAAAFADGRADFEDAVQIAAAVASGLEGIVTRNAHDFVGSPLPVLTPEAFLAQLAAPPDTNTAPGAAVIPDDTSAP